MGSTSTPIIQYVQYTMYGRECKSTCLLVIIYGHEWEKKAKGWAILSPKQKQVIQWVSLFTKACLALPASEKGWKTELLSHGESKGRSRRRRTIITAPFWAKWGHTHFVSVDKWEEEAEETKWASKFGLFKGCTYIVQPTVLNPLCVGTLRTDCKVRGKFCYF